MADLKPPLKGYSIWWMLAEPHHSRMQALIDELSRQWKARSFLAHATLIGLLDYTADQIDDLRTGTDELARAHGVLTAEVMGPGIGDAHFQCVFCTIRPSEQSVACNEAAQQRFARRTKTPQMFHLSGVYGDLTKREQVQAATKMLALLNFPWTVTFDRLALVEVNGYSDEWKIVHEAPLQQK